MSEPAPRCKPEGARAAARFLDPASPAGAALRTTAAAVGAMALAFALHLEVPSLAVVYVLARGSAGTVTMVVGSVAGSATALVLLALFDQSRIAFSLLLFVIGTLATYGALGRRFPYAWVQGLLSMLVLVGQSLDTPDAAVRHAFYDLASVLVAATAAFVAGAAPPAAIPAQLQDALAARLRALAAVLRAAPGDDGAALLAAERTAQRARGLLAVAWPTRLASLRRRRALGAAQALGDLVHDHVLVLAAHARLGSGTTLAAAPPASDATLADGLLRTADLVAARHGPVADELQAQRGAARRAAGDLRRPAATAGDDALATSLERAARRALARLALLAPSLLPGMRAEPPAGAPRRERAAAFDRFRARHAVKSGASYLVILWAWVAAEWGAIVPALVVAVLVATLATPVGATFRKAALRIGGVLAGGLAGLLVAIVLLPFITTLPAICAVAALFLLAFLWVQQHHERLAFAGLQAAIAFTLTLVHGTAPSPTWRAPLESLIGLAFGIGVVVAVMHAVWPIDAATSAHDVLADLLDACRRRLALLARTADAPGARAERAAARTAARFARERAAGFIHEVELHGTQLGRPAEDLARLARPLLELDALLRVVEDLPARAHATSHAVAEHAACCVPRCPLLAEQLRALPGELALATPARAALPLATRPPAGPAPAPSPALAPMRPLPRAGALDPGDRPRAVAAHEIATARALASAAQLIDVLLDDVADRLARGAASAQRRAA